MSGGEGDKLSTKELCVGRMVQLFDMLHVSKEARGVSVYEGLMDSAECDKHLTPAQKEAMGRVRDLWASAMDKKYDPKSGGARPSERCLTPDRTDYDADLAEWASNQLARCTIPAVRSCLPWHLWLYHGILHEPFVQIFGSGVAGLGVMRYAKRHHEQQRAAREALKTMKAGHYKD